MAKEKKIEQLPLLPYKQTKAQACYQAIAKWYLDHPDGDDLPVTKFAKDNNFNKSTVCKEKNRFLKDQIEQNKEFIKSQAMGGATIEANGKTMTVSEILADLNIDILDQVSGEYELYEKLRDRNLILSQLIKSNLMGMVLKHANAEKIGSMPETLLRLTPTLLKNNEA